MVIDLSEVLTEGIRNRNDQDAGAQKKYTVGLEMNSLETVGGNYDITAKKDFELTISRLGKSKVNLSGNVCLTLAIPCDRCLEDTEVQVEFELDKLLDLEDSTEEDNSYVDDKQMDVDKMLYSDIIMNLPMKVLCKEDCKGICKICGTNLNTGSCTCDTFVPDPRMSVISDIFKNFGNGD